MSVPAAAPERSRDQPRDYFLPGFCEASAVFAIVLIAALVGFVLSLARQPGAEGFWFDLARTTVFLNIRQRLDLVFPGRSSVEVEDTVDRYKVRVRFPRFEPGPGSAWPGLTDTLTLHS